MGLRWHLAELLEQAGINPADPTLAISPEMLENTPPAGLDMAELARWCERLKCQPGDLLSWTSEDPADQAARNLAGDLFYQSFLAYRTQEEEEDDEV